MTARHATTVGVFALPLVWLVLLCPSTSGQNATAIQARPTFRTDVELVRLGATVLDENRRPVRGLTANDFAILVDKAPQPIRSFAEVVAPEPAQSTAKWMDAVAPDVRTNTLVDPRLWVLILDDGNMPAVPFMLQTGKAIARDVVSHLGPTDLATVVFTYDGRAAQDFTHDSAKLLTAIERFNYGPILRCPNSCAAEVLLSVRGFLGSLGNPHATMVYVGTGVGVGPPVYAKASDLVSHDDLVQVPFYGFSVAGLAPPDPPDLNGRPALGMSVALRGVQNGNRNLRWLADRSGGLAVTDTNAPAAEVPRLFAERTAYYLIGYQATYPVTDGRYRRLQIQVNRPGVTVYPAERMFLATPSASAKPTAYWASLTAAVAGLLPDGRSPLRVGVAPFGRPEEGRAKAKETATIAMVLGVKLPEELATADSLDVKMVIFDGEGRLQIASLDQTVQIPPAVRARDGTYEFLSQVAVKPGRYNVRFAVGRPGSEALGSVYADVVVPDFLRAPLSVSGLVISATPGPVAAPRDVLASLLPVIPTSRRQFATTDRVTAFLRIYQRGQAPVGAVTLRARILDTTDQAVLDKTETMDPARFTRRTSDWTVDVPVRGLSHGRYLLKIETTMGRETLVRDVIFDVD